MTLCNKDVALATRAPVLNATLLAGVHELNCRYVDLLLTQSTTNIRGPCLPARVLDGLIKLPALARMRLAATSFALFTLGFEDPQFWRAVLMEEGVADGGGAWSQYEPGSKASASEVFCEVALFFVWHTVVVSRVAARVLFAMPESLAERLVQTPLWRLRRIAAEFPGLLLPRWPMNPGFWPDLVRFAASSDWSRLETAQLLGNQLTAVDLDAAEPGRGLTDFRLRRVDIARARCRSP